MRCGESCRATDAPSKSRRGLRFLHKQSPLPMSEFSEASRNVELVKWWDACALLPSEPEETMRLARECQHEDAVFLVKLLGDRDLYAPETIRSYPLDMTRGQHCCCLRLEGRAGATGRSATRCWSERPSRGMRQHRHCLRPESGMRRTSSGPRKRPRRRS